MNASNRAEQINALHQEIEGLSEQIIFKARACGELLRQAKNDVKRGEWLPWLEANFDGKVRTAQRYMRVYDRWEQITANATHVSHLTLREALRLAQFGYSRKVYRKKGRV